MGVSTRNILISGAAALVIGSTAVAGGMGNSGSGGSTSPTPMGVNGPGMGVLPGVTVGQPTLGGGPTMGASGCCGSAPKGHGVTVPGVTVAGPSIVVGGPTVGVGGATIVQPGGKISGQPFLAQPQRRQETVIAPGGSFFSPVPAPASQIAIPGAPERYTEQVTEQVPITEEYCADQITQTSSVRPVQAVCLDDKGTPYPAAQVNTGRSVARTYEGEVFRCLSGTRMQVTLGTLTGQSASFDQADTFFCQKGEALVHRPGGDLSCAPQAPQRNCNERSLLRRHGPGVKLVETRGQVKACIPQTRTVYKTVTRDVERTRATAPTTLQLNGGVGNGVF